MRLHWLRDVLDHSGPFVTGCLDATHDDPAGEHEIDLRWSALETELRDHGAPDDLLARAREAATSSTGQAGKLGRLVVACPDGVVLDLTLPKPPLRSEAVYGPAPHLLPAVRGLSDDTPYVLVEVDHAGADVHWVGPRGVHEEQEVEGGHDVLHKIPGGGWAQRRYQSRVEDSWDRNAEAVAAELDSVVRRHRPPVVLLAGEPRAVSSLLAAVSQPVRDLAVVLDAGGRADGVDATARDEAVATALADHRRTVRAQVVDRFAAGESRQDVAVQSLESVVDALRRAQVDELLLRDDPTSTLRLWVGPEPLQLAATREEVEALGVQDPGEVRADVALVRAAVGSDAGITLWGAETDDEIDLTDGVGALLRWSDASTAHDAVPSMPGHGEAPGE
jgi:hypothetical protein